MDNIKIDFPTFKNRRDAYVKRLNEIYKSNVSKSNIDYFEGTAKFVS